MRTPPPRRPRWWSWDLELTPHLQKRMEDRGFTELDLRATIERGEAVHPDSFGDRFIIVTRHRGVSWEVIVEPDPKDELLVVITAYGVGAS